MLPANPNPLPCAPQVRGLREPARAIRRKCCVIIEIMSKVVDDPRDAAVFLPRLLPGVETVMAEESDPECRTVAQKTVAQLKRIVKVRRDSGGITLHFGKICIVLCSLTCHFRGRT